MKKTLLILAFLSFLAGSASGQGHITTRKYRLSDFSDKITKVVLSGNDMSDSGLRQAVMDRWTLSPFEFCTAADFQKIMKSADYYFLVISEGKAQAKEEVKAEGKADGKEKGKGKDKGKDKDKEKEMDGGDVGIRSLCLYKGGAANLNELMLVVSIPVGNTGGISGRELVFMPAFIDIVQDYTREAMQKEINGYTGLSRYNANYRKDGKTKQIYFAEEDIATAVNEPFRAKYMRPDMCVVPSDEADKFFKDGTFNTLVSYTVFPEEFENESSGYLMLIDAETHVLYYFRKQKVSRAETAGFLPDDIKALARGRK